MFNKFYMSVVSVVLAGCAHQSHEPSQIKISVESGNAHQVQVSAPLTQKIIQFVDGNKLIVMTFSLSNNSVEGDLAEKDVSQKNITSKNSHILSSYQSVSYGGDNAEYEEKEHFKLNLEQDSKTEIKINKNVYHVNVD